ncbi:hypothetical protein CVT24_012966 [Panaeolus cyanescens]|uniref:Uncharacterized protein n=1 Tax=Panaeolus cyanescens TaxID=181874 RepID=A0A409X5H2_9AGAR|nr:hypothetical protein CVT24_012966 [Panaeolus cyanescens]
MSSDETTKPGDISKDTKEVEYTPLQPKLSKTVANWDTWLWDMEMHLGSAGFWDYIKDATTVLTLHAEYQPLASANFRANSNAARCFFIVNVNPKEAQQYNLLAETTPYELRVHLKQIYAKPGPTL